MQEHGEPDIEEEKNLRLVDLEWMLMITWGGMFQWRTRQHRAMPVSYTHLTLPTT